MIALDTHALVWWAAQPKRLPARARRTIDAAIRVKEQVAVSSISVWEIAMLVARGRLQLTLEAETRLSSRTPQRTPRPAEQFGECLKQEWQLQRVWMYVQCF